MDNVYFVHKMLFLIKIQMFVNVPKDLLEMELFVDFRFLRLELEPILGRFDLFSHLFEFINI
jgi:hypothetical protein